MPGSFVIASIGLEILAHVIAEDGPTGSSIALWVEGAGLLFGPVIMWFLGYFSLPREKRLPDNIRCIVWVARLMTWTASIFYFFKKVGSHVAWPNDLDTVLKALAMMFGALAWVSSVCAYVYKWKNQELEYTKTKNKGAMDEDED